MVLELEAQLISQIVDLYKSEDLEQKIEKFRQIFEEYQSLRYVHLKEEESDVEYQSNDIQVLKERIQLACRNQSVSQEQFERRKSYNI